MLTVSPLRSNGDETVGFRADGAVHGLDEAGT